MDNWQLIHSYRRLASEGKVKPFTCANDECEEHELIPMKGHNNNPVLYCAMCDTTYTPGLDLMGQIKAVVYEHTEFG